MADRFAEEWGSMSLDDRLSLCLLMAGRMRALAAVAPDPADKESGLELASLWDRLAFELAKRG